MAVLLNCGSRSERAAQQRTRIVELLESRRIEADLLCSDGGRSIAELARSAAQRPYEVLVAAGGDGTMNAVASAITGTDRAMGVLPLGTVNHFAKYLGIPADLEGAVRTLAEGRRVRIDVGEVNGRVFVNNSTIGIYPRIVRRREQLRKSHGLNKWLAFALATIAGIRRHDFVRLRLLMDEQELRLKTPFVFIANNDFKLGDLAIGPSDPLGSGELGVCVAHPRSRLSILRLLASAAVGRIQSAQDFTVLRTKGLWVDTPLRSLHVATDGEIITLTPPLRYRSRPSALGVIVPQPSERGAGSMPEEERGRARGRAAKEG
jgi:diacylglycerol kinase family enzyme